LSIATSAWKGTRRIDRVRPEGSFCRRPEPGGGMSRGTILGIVLVTAVSTAPLDAQQQRLPII